MHLQLSNRARCLNFGRSFHLHPYFVYLTTQGSCETVQMYSPFIAPYLGSIGIDCVISESCYKGTCYTKKYRKMTISW